MNDKMPEIKIKDKRSKIKEHPPSPRLRRTKKVNETMNSGDKSRTEFIIKGNRFMDRNMPYILKIAFIHHLPDRFFASSRIVAVAVAPIRVMPSSFTFKRSSNVLIPPAALTCIIGFRWLLINFKSGTVAP